jgi:hypothetical protein
MQPQPSGRSRIHAGLLICAVVYVIGAAAIVFGLSRWRTSTVAELSTPAEQESWQTWKTDASKQDGHSGPVARRTPKSDEPPTLVLVREHFGVLVAAALTFYSFLYFLAVFLARGMIGGPSMNGPVRW